MEDGTHLKMLGLCFFRFVYRIQLMACNYQSRWWWVTNFELLLWMPSSSYSPISHTLWHEKGYLLNPTTQADLFRDVNRSSWLWVAQPAKELAVEVDEEEELMREALAEVRWPCSKVWSKGMDGQQGSWFIYVSSMVHLWFHCRQ